MSNKQRFLLAEILGFLNAVGKSELLSPDGKQKALQLAGELEAEIIKMSGYQKKDRLAN